MENATRLQCKALREREKQRRRKNNGYQWKSNAKNNGNNEKYRRVTTSGCDAGGQAMELRTSLPTDRACFAGSADEKQNASEAVGSERADVTLHLLPCATSGGNASGIQSIPAIHGCTHPGMALDRRAGQTRRRCRVNRRILLEPVEDEPGGRHARLGKLTTA
jgi:hypothetical protein